MKLPVRNLSGGEVGSIEVNDAVFGVAAKKGVVWQALVWQRANTHVGTANTLRRGEVSGSTRKPWRQKHTGRARVGEIRSPLWRHGGITFGPRPRSFAVGLPRKMRLLAIKSALSSKRAEGSMIVLEHLDLAEGKTKEMADVLKALAVGTSTLVVTRGKNEKVVRAASNIEGIRTLPAAQLNTGDLLKYQHLVLTVDAVRDAEALLGREINRKRHGEAPTPVTPAPVAIEPAKPVARAKAQAVEAKVTKPKLEAEEPTKPAAKRRTPSTTAARSRSARKKTE